MDGMGGVARVLLGAIWVGVASACVAGPPTTPALSLSCAPLGLDRAGLVGLKASGFDVAAADRGALAIGLVGCLGDADPEIRDGVALEGLTTLLRAGAVDDATKRELLELVTRDLESGLDPEGYRRPFAALTLAELARADRVDAYLSDAELQQVVQTGATFLAGVTDYRGFDERQGWRHGVAHGADLLMQLALNPRLTPESLLRILTAVAAKAVPGEHAYVFGESERLARPLLFAASNPNLPETDWSAWFASLASPAPLGDWREAFASEPALRRLHNLKAFLDVVYIDASLSTDPALQPVAAAALATLASLP